MTKHAYRITFGDNWNYATLTYAIMELHVWEKPVMFLLDVVILEWCNALPDFRCGLIKLLCENYVNAIFTS